MTREVLSAAEINWVCIERNVFHRERERDFIEFENFTLRQIHTHVLWLLKKIIFDVASRADIKTISFVKRSHTYPRHMDTVSEESERKYTNVTHVDPIPSKITSPFFRYIHRCVCAMCVLCCFYLHSLPFVCLLFMVHKYKRSHCEIPD